MRGAVVFSLVAVLCSGCRPAGNPPGDGGAGCSSNDECDDGLDCTVDACGVGGVCTHSPVDALCPSGQVCREGEGCRDAGCTSSEECDDGIACTVDNCGVGGECVHTPVDDLCEGEQRCVEGVGCQLLGCSSAAGCDDGIACTIDDCSVDHECVHTPVDELCEDGERCIVEWGCVGPCESAEDCDDGDFCNGAERCLSEFGCLPAEEPRDCDDGDECTIDSCDPVLNQCVYEVNGAIPGCDTFETSDLSGCFAITPRVSQSCAVRYGFEEVCFELFGPVLSVTAGRFELTQNPAPDDEHFRVELEVTGGCTERYSLTGTFSGADTFSGSWVSQFINVDGFSCALGGCRDLNVPVTATRVSGP